MRHYQRLEGATEIQETNLTRVRSETAPQVKRTTGQVPNLCCYRLTDHPTIRIMARARSSKKSKQSIRPKGVAAKYTGAPTFYANFAAVASTPQELIIDFCLIAPPVDVDSVTQLVNAPVSARVITNLTFGRALVDALNTRLKAAESEASKNTAKSSVIK